MKVCNKFPVTPEFIAKCCQGSTNIYKQHIMQALMECGYTTSVFGDLYKMLFSKESKMNVLMESKYPEPTEIIEAIHEAGGIAVLAHPHQYRNEALLEELIAAGLDGVEVWHPSHTEEQTEALLQLTEQKGLLATGGSDFHGMYNRTARAVGSTSVPDDRIAALLAYKSK
jgi:predicted metal-dependent phosphoesterase TrpH